MPNNRTQSLQRAIDRHQRSKKQSGCKDIVDVRKDIELIMNIANARIEKLERKVLKLQEQIKEKK